MHFWTDNARFRDFLVTLARLVLHWDTGNWKNSQLNVTKVSSEKMLPTLLALTSLFSQKYGDYAKNEFPKTYPGVTSELAKELTRPFDFIVVGSGYAGSYMAHKLANRRCKYRVLLLEAGGLPSFDQAIPFARLKDLSDVEWGYTSVPQRKAAKAFKDRKVHLMAGKSLGGDSVVDPGLYVPPNLADFHRWSYLYNLDGWGYVEMKPHMFKHADDHEDVYEYGDGVLTDDPLVKANLTETEAMQVLNRGLANNLMDPLKIAWLKAGKELNYSLVTGNNQNMFHDGGFFVPKTMSHGGLKMNSVAQFLKHAPKNLVIASHAQVVRLLFTRDKRRVVGVAFKDTLTGKTYIVDSLREVILSAGTIGSAQILMQSGIGPKDHLREQQIPVVKDLPVGVRLNDRVRANMYLRMQRQFAQGLKNQINDPGQLHSFLVNGTGILANSSISGCGLLRTGYLVTPDIMLEMKPVGILGLDDLLRDTNYRTDVLEKIDKFGDSFHDGCLQVSITVLRPFSQGTMWLWRRHDGSFTPRMNPSYLADERDITALIQGWRNVEAMVQNKYMQALGAEIMYPEFPDCPPPILPSTEKYCRCVMEYLATSGGHMTSTVPLGEAVDSRLRVDGISGVRVVDQSIFPEPASGGVSATVLAVANRAYRMIVKDNQMRC